MQVVVFFTAWLVFWMGTGAAVGSIAFGSPWAGTVNGFFFAILATFAWPWIVPRFVNDWMDDSSAPTW